MKRIFPPFGMLVLAIGLPGLLGVAETQPPVAPPSATPAPATPAPATPAPATPAPATPAPATPAPATPAPATPAPATPAPATPAPATPAPATPAPATPAPTKPVVPKAGPSMPVPGTPVPSTPKPVPPTPKKEGEESGEKKADASKSPAGEKPPEKKKTIAEVTKNCTTQEGLFRLYADKETGALFLYIKKSQLDREFLYFAHVVDGVVGAGRNRGQFQNNDVFSISKHYGRLEFVVHNTDYYFDPSNALARAAGANVSRAIVVTEQIQASDDDGYLIGAGNLFLKEAFMQVKPNSANDSKSFLGKLSESKSKFLRWGSYPKNSFFVAEYVYENPAPPTNDDDAKNVSEVADHRYVSIAVQHTFVAMPDDVYQPRSDDPRVGYFMSQITDQTSAEVLPYRDFIHRWNLRKKDPKAELSEPVEPIVWWIENTTPMEFRETILQAGLLWNRSFEKIGYKNAIVIKQQPDDADWTADDLEHNVLRWTSSPKPPFGGYGPHFVNPRTGQILGADIMLEYSFIKKNVQLSRLWASRPGEEEDSLDPRACVAGSFGHQSLLLGWSILKMRNSEPIEIDTLMKEGISQLILHEIGHTLGLTHNFRASTLHSPEELRDRKLTEKTGIGGSVMDYMPINLGPDKKRQGQYFMDAPGPYDDWVIEYGYSDTLADPKAEAQRLMAIAARSTQPELAYSNDADDMRRPGKAIDPRAQVYDLSNDPVAFGTERCELVRSAMEKLLTTAPVEGQSWHVLTQSYQILTNEANNALTTLTRYIGGVYVERAFVGQGDARVPDPFRPVEAEKQMSAMKTLQKYAFGPDAWTMPEKLLSHLQQQRRGFNFGSEGEDPKLHDRILTIQRGLLDHLFHRNTQTRILDSTLYGNTYALSHVMRDLTSAIITGDPDDALISTLRQNLQLEYLDRLVNVVKNRTLPPTAQSVAFHQLKTMETHFQKMLAASNNTEIRSIHANHVLYRIKQGLDLRP